MPFKVISELPSLNKDNYYYYYYFKTKSVLIVNI